MRYLLTVSILLLSFSADISFANDRAGEQTSTVEKTENEVPTIPGLTDVENKFLVKAGELAKISNTPASDLIAFMKENRLSSSIAKKLKDLLERFQYKISEKPGGGISISYSKEDRIQADDDINGSYNIIGKNRGQSINDYTPTCPYHYSNMTNDDIAIRIQNLDKTIRLVSSDIGLLNDSIISTKIKLDGIVHNLNNIIGYIQMTDGYKWQSFLQNSQIEKNNQLPKEYIVSMDNLSKTLNDMSVVLKQNMEQRTNAQPQVIQQPCQQIVQPQYIDNLNKTIADLSIMLQQALKHSDSQDKQQCQSCLINEQINKANDNKTAREHIESLESINKTLLGMSEKLNAVINHKHDNHNAHAADLENKRVEQDRINTLANLNASLINISNELQKVTNKVDTINDKDVNITVIGQGGLQSSNASNAHDRIAADDSNHKQEVIDKMLKNKHTETIEERINTEKSISKDDINTEESKEIGATSEISTPENKEDNVSTEKTEEPIDVKQVEESVSHEKVEKTPAEEQKNLGIIKKEIAAFENLIENKGPESGHNGIVENDSNTSKYNEIKTELEGEVKNDGKELTPANVPPPPPLLPEDTKLDELENKQINEDDKSVVAITKTGGSSTDEMMKQQHAELISGSMSDVNEIPHHEKTIAEEKVEKTPAEEPKNLGIVKKEIAAFENLIENKGPESGHNGIVENDLNTSKYNEIKTELDGEVKNDGKELTSANVPPPPPLLPEPNINEKERENLIVPTTPPASQLLAEDKKVDENIDKEAEKEAAYERFLEKRRLEREKELRQIRGIEDDDSTEKASITPPPPPPAPALDMSKVPAAPAQLKINKKSSTTTDNPAQTPKKLGIVAEMAKRFEALNKNGGSQAGHNGIVKKDSHTSGYNETKHHLKKTHK